MNLFQAHPSCGPGCFQMHGYCNVCLLNTLHQKKNSFWSKAFHTLQFSPAIVTFSNFSNFFFYLLSSLKLIQTTFWNYSRVLNHFVLQLVIWLRKHECVRKEGFSELFNLSKLFARNWPEIKILCPEPFCKICQTFWLGESDSSPIKPDQQTQA